MGVTIRQKTKGGPYWIFVHHDGRRISRSVGSLKAARAVKAEIEAAIARGDFNLEKEQEMPLFGEYAQRWLETYVERELRASSYDNYEVVLRLHLLPAFGNKRLDEITRGDVRDFLLEKAKTRSLKRVLLMKDIISGVLGWALDEGLIAANPAIGATKRLFRRDPRKAEPQDHVWSEAELDRFLETCREREPGFYPLFLLLARTGCRLGEAIALKWVNVDFRDRTISLTAAYRHGRLTPPKNGKPRTVDMSAQLGAVLEGWKPAKFLDAKALVFPAPGGGHFEQSEVRKIFNRIVREAGVKRIKLHGLRHTAASLLLSKGVSPYYVSQQLGHSSIQITADIYGQWIRNEANRHVDLLDSAPQNAPPARPEECERAVTH